MKAMIQKAAVVVVPVLAALVTTMPAGAWWGGWGWGGLGWGGLGWGVLGWGLPYLGGFWW